jgi:hypothetical protein
LAFSSWLKTDGPPSGGPSVSCERSYAGIRKDELEIKVPLRNGRLPTKDTTA